MYKILTGQLSPLLMVSYRH
uniref:Uncharacterized protein n=1 Tax=Romanomermis culicivorax TaxID=13658 RepID=A0A915HNA2_ROMCU